MDHAGMTQDRRDLEYYRAKYGPVPVKQPEYVAELVAVEKVVSDAMKKLRDLILRDM